MIRHHDRRRIVGRLCAWRAWNRSLGHGDDAAQRGEPWTTSSVFDSRSGMTLRTPLRQARRKASPAGG